MDLDADKVTNSMSDAMIQAEILKGFQQPPPPPQGPPPEGGQPPMASEPAPAGANVEDTTGGGGANIGMGTAPLPEEEGFTGNVQ